MTVERTAALPEAREAIEALARARQRASACVYHQWLAFDVRELLAVRIRSVEALLPMVAKPGTVDDVRRGRYEICRARLAIRRWEEEHDRLRSAATAQA